MTSSNAPSSNRREGRREDPRHEHRHGKHEGRGLGARRAAATTSRPTPRRTRPHRSTRSGAGPCRASRASTPTSTPRREERPRRNGRAKRAIRRGAQAARRAASPRRKKNHEAPTMSHTRPISDVSCGTFENSAPTAATKTVIATAAAAIVGRDPRRWRTRSASAPDSGQAPGERASQRAVAGTRPRSGQHSEPQMPLVIQREIAIAEMPVGRQVEQQQPAEARGHDQSGIPDARGDRLRHRLAAVSRARVRRAG